MSYLVIDDSRRVVMMDFGSLIRYAARLDVMGHSDLADKMDQMLRGAQENPLYQENDWSMANGYQADQIRKDAMDILKDSDAGERVNPEWFARKMRFRYNVLMSPEEAEEVLDKQQRKLGNRTRHRVSPWVYKVGEMVLDGGFTVEDIEEYTDGALMDDEIVKLWKQYLKLHPEVSEDLLKRRDVAYSVPAKPNEDLLYLLRDPEATPEMIADLIDGVSPEALRSHMIGPQSGDTKVRMRSKEDLDAAAIEAYRLSLLPEYQRENGSPDLGKLSEMFGGTPGRVRRQLQRAEWIIRGRDTQMSPRNPDVRDAARDLVSEMSAAGLPWAEIVERLNETVMPGEEPWTDIQVTDLFMMYPGGDVPRFNIPREEWENWEDYTRERVEREREELGLAENERAEF